VGSDGNAIGHQSKPTRDAIAFAFVANSFGRNSDALRGLAPLLYPIVAQRHGKLFEPTDFAKALNAHYDFDVSPLVAESLVPALVAEGLLKEVRAAPNTTLFRCDAPEAPQQYLSDAGIEGLFAEFRQYARARIPTGATEVSDDRLDQLLHDALTESEFLKVTLQNDKSTFRGRTLVLKKEQPEPDAHVITDGSLRYLVAQFIADLEASGEARFERLVQASWGSLISEVVLALQRPNAPEKAFANLAVYMDGPIILDALDVGEELDAKYARDLLDLLRKSGPRLKTFGHVLQEMHGVISTPLSLMDTNQYASGPMVMRIQRNPYHAAHVRGVLGNLKARVEALGIEIEDDAKFETQELKEIFPDDHIDTLRKSFGADHLHFDRLQRDAQSIAYVMRMRRGEKASSVSDAKAIFVTRNAAIATASARVLGKVGLLFPYMTPPCVTDRQLAGVAWFCTGGGGQKLERLKLIANCASAVIPRTDLVSTMAQHLFDKKVPLESFEALMRNDRASMVLVRETLGNPTFLTPENALEILEKMKGSLIEVERKQHQEDIAEIRRALDAESTAKLDDARRVHESGLEEMARDAKAKISEKEATIIQLHHALADASQASKDLRVSASEREFAASEEMKLLRAELGAATQRADALDDHAREINRIRAERLEATLNAVRRRLEAELILGFAALVYLVINMGADNAFAIWGSVFVCVLSFWKVPHFLIDPIVNKAIEQSRVKLAGRLSK